MAATAEGAQMDLTLALSYGGRSEIVQAAQALAREVQAGRLKPEQIDAALFARYLYTADMPDPDLLIRTSGECRLSNFLLWQSAYTELYITETLWPDFREEDFLQALEAYRQRDRRFGLTQEQIEAQAYPNSRFKAKLGSAGVPPVQGRPAHQCFLGKGLRADGPFPSPKHHPNPKHRRGDPLGRPFLFMWNSSAALGCSAARLHLA